jgi:hypothetical protein
MFNVPVVVEDGDFLLFSLLNALDLFDPPVCPTFNSIVIIEMFIRKPDKKYFIRFSYRNETDHDPYILRMFNGGCDEYCPLSKFEDLSQPLRPEDW